METDGHSKEHDALAAIATADTEGTPLYGKQLDRNFSLLSICATGLVVGNTWVAVGGSIATAIYNGGPPGVLYQFIVTSVFYWIIAASLAELASAIPSAGGVYHWATVAAGPRWGRVCGFFAGWWNFVAWIFGPISISLIAANCAVQMYAVEHPDYVAKSWHVFVCYQILNWASVATVLFANRALPVLNNIGLFLILAGLVITVIVCAVLPGDAGAGHASNDFVWKDWSADIGYSSDGFVFMMGMLNAAFAVGTPDVLSHLAEEIPRPEINVPKAMAAQMLIGFLTAFAYLIALFYSISDLDAVLAGTSPLPVAAIYRQASGSSAGAVGLLLLLFLPVIPCAMGGYLAASRVLWTLARDGATPFSRQLATVHPRLRNPANAILVCGVIATLVGCIYLGSSTAFNAIVGSFVVLTTVSYLAAILPYLLTNRRYVTPGPFFMKGAWGMAMHGVTCIYIPVFIVVFCFPYALPVSAGSMNYSCLILGGSTLFITLWWFRVRSRGYRGPRDVIHGIAEEESLEGEVREVGGEKV